MYFNENIIKQKIELYRSHKKNPNKKTLHIAYGIDKNFLFGAAISSTSVLINNTLSISLHFFIDFIDADIIHRFEKMAEKFKIDITIYHIDNTPLEKLPAKNWPYSAYYRLIAFDYLGKDINKLLYLDADVMCKGNLDELITLDLVDHVCAVVPDIKEMHPKAVERLNIPELKDVYFNSGVMLVNLKKWHQEQLTSKTISFILENSHLKYPDQDALNVLLINRTYLLPRKFNCIYSIKSELSDKSHQQYKHLINNESILIHYVGTTKPWSEWGQYPSTIFFKQAYEQSTWQDVPLLAPGTPLQWKKKSKHEFVKRKYISAIKSRIKYILSK
ncbi:glycosyltransferase [Brenneria sp. g21c3]|uniref:glycosyltransferase family 8 protein n=1 Tax=Brenneria sp. g21c3 TaxID=3093893 RepID=UPI002EBA70CB|nr:glycosyltransferase [Brenneria sp. g21c3]